MVLAWSAFVGLFQAVRFVGEDRASEMPEKTQKKHTLNLRAGIGYAYMGILLSSYSCLGQRHYRRQSWWMVAFLFLKISRKLCKKQMPASQPLVFLRIWHRPSGLCTQESEDSFVIISGENKCLLRSRLFSCGYDTLYSEEGGASSGAIAKKQKKE